MAQAGRLVWELGQGLRRRFDRFTKKQMGDAGEMLVAAELTLWNPGLYRTESVAWLRRGRAMPRKGFAAHLR